MSEMTGCLTFVSVHWMRSGCCSASVWVRMGREGHKEWEAMNFSFSKFKQNHLQMWTDIDVKCKMHMTNSAVRNWPHQEVREAGKHWTVDLGESGNPWLSLLRSQDKTVRVKVGFGWDCFSSSFRSWASYGYSTTTTTSDQDPRLMTTQLRLQSLSGV